MRIAHVSDCYLPRLGGIEMQVHDLAIRQRALGHQTEVITVTAQTDVPGVIEADPPWVRRLKPEVRSLAIRPLAAAPSAPALLTPDRFDAVHVHLSLVSPFGVAAAAAAARSGIPTVATVHSMLIGMRPLYRIADTVVGLLDAPLVWSAVSARAAEPVRRLVPRGTPVSVLPNGIDPAAWRLPTPPPRRSTVVVTSVMRLARRKRPMPLLHMLRRLRKQLPVDVRLQAVIVGDGPMREAMDSYLWQHRMDGWVRLTGRLERHQIRRVFASSDLYVAPTGLESFGIAALEARSAGLPVVASARGGVGEFVTEGRDGLLAATDRQMVDALARLVTDTGLRIGMAEHNRTVPPQVTWPEVLGRAEMLYDAAADLARRTRHARRPTAGPSRTRPKELEP